jgi:hypothetical protein
LARVKSGDAAEMPLPEMHKAGEIARQVIESDLEGLGPLMLALRLLREPRPPWFSAPLYAELLAPFDSLCLSVLGQTPERILQEAVGLNDARGESAELGQKFPELLLQELVIDLDQVETPADLRNRVFVRFDEGYSYVLGYNAADAVYRGVTKLLGEASPTFGTRKGRSLEQFVRRRIERLAPSWSVKQGVVVDGKEKDLLAWDEEVAVAVECKGLKIRGSSADWSFRNLESDITSMESALGQLKPAMGLLEEGGILDGTRIPAHRIVQGLVITDDPATSFVRQGLDRLDLDDSDPTWHGHNVWMGSVLDLEYLSKVAGSMSVLLHYFRRYRNRAEVRKMDEPEAWSAYGVATTHLMRKVGALLVIKEHDWEKSRQNGVESFAPQWLQRLELAQQFDSRRATSKGLRIVEQDLSKAVRTEEQSYSERSPTNDLTDEDLETFRKIITDLQHERATRPKHPYRSL